MIQLLIGPYRSGKTGRVLNELVDHKRTNPLDLCLILVPSHRYGRLLKQQLHGILRNQSLSGLFGVQIATIYEACHQIFRGAGEVVNVLPGEICTRLLARSLEHVDERSGLAHLKAIRHYAGTSSSLMRLVDEFERAALAPQDVISSVDTTAADASRRK